MLNLSALSPFGPIFDKELRSTARRKRTYVLRCVYLGALLLLLLMVYTGFRERGEYGSVAHRQEQQAEMGYAFFVCFSMFCVISMAVLGPILTATAISSERQQKTLHVLLMTPITSWQIISGKLFSRLLVALMLIGLSLPALAVARLLGGVELNQMFAVICLCAATALFTAAVGLFYSTFMNRAFAVILLSYATIGFLYLFVPMIAITGIASNRFGRRGPPMGLFEFISAIAPPWSVAMVASGERTVSGVDWRISVAVALVLTALMVLFCGLVLRRIARRQGESSTAAPPPPPITVGPSLPERGLNEMAAAIPPPLPLAYAPASVPLPTGRTVGDNPVLWREVRRPLMAKRWQAIVGSIVCVLLLGVTYASLAASWGEPLKDAETQTIYAVFFNALLMLVVCVVSATAIAGEKESDTWTLLLATPLGAGEIVRGKFLGLMRRMVWPWILIVTHFTIFALCGVISFPSWVMTLWILFSFNILWMATGLYFSLRFKRVTFAVTMNLLLPIVAYLVMLALLAILGEFLANSHDWPEFVGWYAPYPYLITGILGLSKNNYLWLPYHNSATPPEFLTAVTVAGCAYLAATAMILYYTATRFDRIVGRAPQRQRGLIS